MFVIRLYHNNQEEGERTIYTVAPKHFFVGISTWNVWLQSLSGLGYAYQTLA